MYVTNGYGEGLHTGSDYNCVDFNLSGVSDAGIPIQAVADGKVVYAQWNTGGYGFRVVVDHGYGITSNYSHGASINVNVGDSVRQGQELMVISNTGTTYPHLHFGMRKDDKSMELTNFSGCPGGCDFTNINSDGYTSDNEVNNLGKIIEENEAEKSGVFDGNESYYGHYCKYSWENAVSDTPTLTLTYRPMFSEKATCDILVYIPPENATTTAAKYKIKHSGGEEIIIINQKDIPSDPSKPNNWVRLGNKSFEFGVGVDYYVRVGNAVNDYKKGQKVGFDAVYFKVREGGGYTGTPKIYLNRANINFGVIISRARTNNEKLVIRNKGDGTLNWSVSSNSSWLNLSPTVGSNFGIVTISVDSNWLSPGIYTDDIVATSPNADNSPQTVSVTLKVYQPGGARGPFGEFATPVNGSTAQGSIPVTGWVLDDIEVTGVKIYNGNSYIGDALLIEGARPDVEQAYAEYPMSYKAGWGYMLLSNFLPNNGNGTYTLYAKAYDKEGNEVTLGSKTIYCSNAHAVKPFGAIDTPLQGGTASGKSFQNWGWVLTPIPNYIPTNGSTINVFLDGVNLGHPTYNIFRSDIASFFPGYSNSIGAAGCYYLDTTKYADGVHTIHWIAADNAGNSDGVGSRYFTIQNGGSASAAEKIISTLQHGGYHSIAQISEIPVDPFEPIHFKKGYNEDSTLQTGERDEKDIVNITLREDEPVKIYLSEKSSESSNPTYAGYHVIGDHLKSLPIGSTIDSKNGVFYWQPSAGFVGDYEFVFIGKDSSGVMTQKKIHIKILPKF